MGLSTPNPSFREVVDTLFPGDIYQSVHVTHFKGDPHNKEEAKWFGERLSTNPGYLHRGPAPDQNHFICMGVLDPNIPGRSVANVIGHVAFWMDDVGTKVDREKVREFIHKFNLFPTMIVETSPANYSYFWAFGRVIPEDGSFEAQTVHAVRAALKAGGWGDPVSQDAARYMRSGFGVNGKAAYASELGPFEVTIHLFEKHNRVDVNTFAAAIMGPDWRNDITSGKYLTSGQIVSGNIPVNSERRATMDDPLVKLAMEVGLDPQPSTRAGVIDCHCPNEAAHTGGDPTGYAIINDGMSFCNHASCQHLRSPDFEDLMVAKYDDQIAAGLMFGTLMDNPFGPGILDVATGARVSSNGKAFLARARFEGVGVDMGPGAARGGAAVEDLKGEAEALASRSAEKDEQKAEIAAGLFKRFIYVQKAEAFYDRRLKELISQSRLDKDADVIAVWGYHKGEKSGSFRMLNDRRLVRVETVTVQAFRADVPPASDTVEVETKSGITVEAVNTFVPTNVGFAPGAPDKWLDHLDFMFGDQPEVKEYLIEYMAFCVQHPDVKMSVIPLIVGQPGVGKDLMVTQPLFRILGLHNVRPIVAKQLADDFNDFLTYPVIYLGEFSLKGRDGDRVYNRLKDYTSPSPVSATINPKYGKTFEMPVSPKFIGTTNNEDAVTYVPIEDRRFFIAKSNAEAKPGPGQGTGPGTDPYFAVLDKWIKDPVNLERIHRFLMDRKITVFNPNSAPPRNEARHDAIVSGLGPVAGFAYDLVTNGELAGRKVFDFQEVHSRVLASNDPMVRFNVYPHIIAEGLRAAGCKRLERMRVNGKVTQLWTGACVTTGDGKLLDGSAINPSERDGFLRNPGSARDAHLQGLKELADKLASAA